jgi:hypothetical protein
VFGQADPILLLLGFRNVKEGIYTLAENRPSRRTDPSGLYSVLPDGYSSGQGNPDEYDDPCSHTEWRCGPDITSWLQRKMDAAMRHPIVDDAEAFLNWARYIPFFGLGANYGLLEQFRELVKPGGPWDFKRSMDFSTPDCPSPRCKRTVTLCGVCMDYDVPGNLFYGWIGRVLGISGWLLHSQAAKAQEGGSGVDDPNDTEAINAGFEIVEKYLPLCTAISRRVSKMNLHLECSPCGTVFRPYAKVSAEGRDK